MYAYARMGLCISVARVRSVCWFLFLFFYLLNAIIIIILNVTTFECIYKKRIIYRVLTNTGTCIYFIILYIYVYAIISTLFRFVWCRKKRDRFMILHFHDVWCFKPRSALISGKSQYWTRACVCVCVWFSYIYMLWMLFVKRLNILEFALNIVYSNLKRSSESKFIYFNFSFTRIMTKTISIGLVPYIVKWFLEFYRFF